MATGTPGTQDRRINPKLTARRQLETLRRKLDPAWASKASEALQRRAMELPEFKKAAVIGCYLATSREPQTAALIDTALAQGKRVCIPAWRAAEQCYDFCEYRKDFELLPGPYQILEPKEPSWILPDELALMIVPCLGFDVHGRRLGHGGGHFDRLMAASRCERVCLAFEFQKLTAVPVEPHDMPVDIIVTEAATYDARD